MTEKIAVYGAAFNPPHAGHLDAIAQLLAQVDRVLVVPSYRHAFGKTMAPFAQRVAMVKAALTGASFAPDQVQVDLTEQQLAAAKAPAEAVYSWDLLQAVQRRHPDARVYLAIGPDNANPALWQKFHRHDDIDARWQKLVVEERVHVRSSAVRESIAAGAAVPDALLPVGVAQLIDEFGLYR